MKVSSPLIAGRRPLPAAISREAPQIKHDAHKIEAAYNALPGTWSADAGKHKKIANYDVSRKPGPVLFLFEIHRMI